MEATTAAPEEMPQSRPSSLASRLAMSTLSLLLTLKISSSMLGSSTLGTNPAPIPCIYIQRGRLCMCCQLLDSSHGSHRISQGQAAFAHRHMSLSQSPGFGETLATPMCPTGLYQGVMQQSSRYSSAATLCKATQGGMVCTPHSTIHGVLHCCRHAQDGWKALLRLACLS